MDSSAHFHDSVTSRNVIAAPHASDGGTIHFNFNGPSETISPHRAASSRTPFSTVPFPPDPNFIDRPEIINWVRERLARPGARVALVGLGGIGKSQLAIHYAHQVRERTPDKWVFWVHSSTEARFKQDFQFIANRLELPGRNHPEANILQLVSDWLRVEENGNWEMILDNADDVNILFSTTQRPLASFLPKSRNGSILVTSRSKDAAGRLVGDFQSIYQIPVMNNHQANQLLREKLGDKYDESSASKLVAALDYMPLAITHAASFINSRSSRFSISRYLDQFRESDKRKESLLHKDVGDLRRDESASNSIIKTWQITFEQVRDETPSATDILFFMSFFNPHGIPEFALQSYIQYYKPDCESDLDEDIEILLQYSLIMTSTETGSHMLEMHPLVQLCTKIWLKSFGNVQQWEGRFLHVVSSLYPQWWKRNWEVSEALEPHLEELITYKPTNVTDADRYAVLLHSAGHYRLRRGRDNEAEQMIRRSLKLEEAILGNEHEGLLDIRSSLAFALTSQGKREEAESINRQSREIIFNIFGKAHPRSIEASIYLALDLKWQHKYIEAEAILRSILIASERTVGREHSRTLQCLTTLASVLHSQGKADEAEPIQQNVLEALVRYPNKEDPLALSSMVDLAKIFKDQGQHEQAEQLFLQGLDWCKSIHDQHAFEPINIFRLLGDTLLEQSRTSEAIPYLVRAHKGFRKLYGWDSDSARNTVRRLRYLNELEENKRKKTAECKLTYREI